MIDEKKIEEKRNNSKVDEFVIPYEAACSHEFVEGCIIMEDEADKHLEESRVQSGGGL
jgi:hypothetical protein